MNRKCEYDGIYKFLLLLLLRLSIVYEMGEYAHWVFCEVTATLELDLGLRQGMKGTVVHLSKHLLCKSFEDGFYCNSSC